MQSVMALDFGSSTQISDVVFNPDLPCLSSLVKKYSDNTVDRTQAYNFLQEYILGITAYFGAVWSDFQIEEFAKDFFREFYFFNQADLKLFFNRIKATEFKEYGNISPKLVMNELLKYRDARLIEAEIESINKKSRTEAEWKKLSAESDRRRDADTARFNFLMDGKNDKEKKLKEIISNQSKYITSLTTEEL